MQLSDLFVSFFKKKKKSSGVSARQVDIQPAAFGIKWKPQSCSELCEPHKKSDVQR